MYTDLKRIYVSKTCSFSGQAPPTFSLAKLSSQWHQTFTPTISKQTQKHQFLTFFIHHAVPTSAFQKPLLNYYNFTAIFILAIFVSCMLQTSGSCLQLPVLLTSGLDRSLFNIQIVSFAFHVHLYEYFEKLWTKSNSAQGGWDSLSKSVITVKHVSIRWWLPSNLIWHIARTPFIVTYCTFWPPK